MSITISHAGEERSPAVNIRLIPARAQATAAGSPSLRWPRGRLKLPTQRDAVRVSTAAEKRGIYHEVYVQ